MKEESLKNKVFSGVFWQFGERICAQGIEFIVSVVLARILLPEDYGLVAMTSIFITIAYVFATSGFSTALIQRKDADDVDFSTNFYCSLVCGILAYAVLFLIAPIIADFYEQPMLETVLRVCGLKIPLGVYNSVQHAYVSRHMIFKKFFFSTIGGTLFSGVVGVIMAYAGCGVWALVAQTLVNLTFDTIILSVTVPWRPKKIFSVEAAKEMMSYGWKVLAADMVGTIFNQLRGLIIGKVYTSADLAYYNKGDQLPSMLSGNISSTVQAVLFPAMSNRSDNMESVKMMAKKANAVMSYIIFPMMVGLAVVAKPLITILYTEKWIESVIFLQILSLSQAVTVLSGTSLQVLKAIGRSDALLKLEIYKKPVYLVLLIIGVNINVYAIAVTMLIYSVYGTLVNANQLKKFIAYPLKEQIFDIIPALILSGVMGMIVYFISYVNLNIWVILILQVILGVGVYWIMSILTRNESYYYLVDFIKEKVRK